MRAQGRFTSLIAGFAPGFLAGTQIAGLLFFLNPEIPLAPATWTRAVLLYGSLLGAAGLAIQLPFLWRRPSLARRVLPWALTGVLALSALLQGVHASRLAFFLPPGINERLLKAAMWLTLGTLISFYTALLHTLHGRRYGLRSRVGLTIVALAAVYVMIERREAFRPRTEPAPLTAAVEELRRPNLLFVGLESATLDAVLPLAEKGDLPFLAEVVRQGAYGHLEGFTPSRRLALWSTLSTGKLPFKHGIVGGKTWILPSVLPGRLRLLPVGLGFQHWGLPGGASVPVSALDRLSLPIWEVLPRLGIPTGVIGLPLTDPTPGGTAYCFSERFFETGASVGLATPTELAERGLLFRVGADELDPALVRSFQGRLGASVSRALAGDRWRESLTRFLLEQRQDARAVFVLLPGLEVASRRWFGGFSAVEFGGSQDAGARQARQRLISYYRYLDTILADLWNGLREPRLLAVVSASGSRRKEGLSRAWGQLVANPPVAGVTWDGSDGVLLFRGDGVNGGARIDGASLVDVVPTLAYGLGLPIARDLDGQVLTAGFNSRHLASHPMVFVPSYDALGEPVAPSAPGVAIDSEGEETRPGAAQPIGGSRR